MTEYQLRPLTDLFEIDKAQISRSDDGYSTLSFVGLENIESHTKRYLPEFASEPEGTCNRFTAQHILYGKLRPYLNKVFLPDFDGKCSTEIVPLKPKNGYSRNFVSIILQSQTFIEEAVKHSTGGRMPRANLKHLLKLKVRTPAAEDANIIADNLQSQLARVETMRQEAFKQKEAAKALQSAVLRDVFPWQAGEALPDGWHWEKVGKYAKFKNGLNYSSSDIQPGVKVVGVSCFQDNFYLNEVNDVEIVKERVREEDFLKKNDILIVRSNGSVDLVGRHLLYVGNEKVTHSGFTIRLRLDNTAIDPVYYMYFARSDFFKIQTRGQGANIKNVSQGKLSNVDIPLPRTVDDQLAIVEKIKNKFEISQKAIASIDGQLNAIETLPPAILREAIDIETNEK